MADGPGLSRAVIAGGGIAGLAAAHRLEQLLGGTEIVLIDAAPRLGGKVLTEHVGGFVVEGAPDSFLTSKPRGVGLCEELGLAGRLIPRNPHDRRTYVRLGGALHALPEGLTGMVPTRMDAMEASGILSPEGLARMAQEPDVPASPADGDESVAAFVRRRMGAEAYDRLVGPLMTGIFGGDGDQLSLAAAFPALRTLEIEHGSVIRGLLSRTPEIEPRPPFVSLAGGVGEVVDALVSRLRSTRILTGRRVTSLAATAAGYEVRLDEGEALTADAVILATPAYATAEIAERLDRSLAEAHAAIPHASSVVVTLGYAPSDAPRGLNGYGYVIPEIEGSDVLACTWSSSKWHGRAPEGHALVRAYIGRFGGPDVTGWADEDLVALARRELAQTLGAEGRPDLVRIHRWPRGMPQYVVGHLDRVAEIESRVAEHPRLALAGAAYRGVGIPDCIASGEAAADRVAAA